jgi:hypothetical protein
MDEEGSTTTDDRNLAIQKYFDSLFLRWNLPYHYEVQSEASSFVPVAYRYRGYRYR